LSEAKFAEILKQWRTDPVLFVLQCFEWGEGEGATDQQIEGLNTVGAMANAKVKTNLKQNPTEKERELARKMGISIRSGHGTGKDAFLCWIYWWLLVCFPHSIGYVTAPTSHQLGDILWKEFSKWQRKSPLLMEKFEVLSDKVFCKEAKKEWFISARTAVIKGSEEEQGETLAGQHGDYMVLAGDESSVLPPGIFRPVEGALTGIMNFIILIGNPTRGKGYFFDTFHKDKEHWVNLHWNSEESERVTSEFTERMAKKYGRQSNIYRVRVLGEFPTSTTDTLIPYEWVLDAVDRELEIPPDSYKMKGCDVGTGGDDSVILTRKGNRVTDVVTYGSPDTMQIVGWCMRELAEEDDYDFFLMDNIGVGAGVYDRLRELKIRGLVSVDVRRSSVYPNCYKLRDELFWKLREVFEAGTISIPDDPVLIEELMTIKYDDPETTKGKIKIESKKKMRERGLPSPNRADALAFTYYFGDASGKSVKDNRFRKKRKPLSWRVV